MFQIVKCSKEWRAACFGEMFPPGACFLQVEPHLAIAPKDSLSKIDILKFDMFERSIEMFKSFVESHLDEQPVSRLFIFALLSKPNVVRHLNPK